MGLAAKISDPTPEELFREMIHDEVDKWVDEIVADVFKDDRQPTLTELSDLFAQTKQKFFGACLQTFPLWKNTISRLFFAEIGNVIGGLRRMHAKNGEAEEEIRKLIVYLHNNRKRIHYRGDRIGGYPIGSGGIESANKFICHTRMKRSGAWWVKETGNAMLRIRCSIYNGTYDGVFQTYKQPV